MIAVGTTPMTTFDRSDLYEGLLYLMAYYYPLHLTYLRWISTLLSVLQTEILKDSIHDRDSTPPTRKRLVSGSHALSESLLDSIWLLFHTLLTC